MRSPENLLFGAFLIGVGTVGLVAGWHLPMGEALRMGSGYLPKVLSSLLIAFGVIIGGSSLAIDGPPLTRWAWRELAIVLGSFALFGAMIERSGLILAMIAVMLVSTFAASDRRWGESLLFAVIVAAACALLFRGLLGLPLDLWPKQWTF